MKFTSEGKAILKAALLMLVVSIVGIPLLALLLTGTVGILFGGITGEVGFFAVVVLSPGFAWGMWELGNYLMKHIIEGFTRAG